MLLRSLKDDVRESMIRAIVSAMLHLLSQYEGQVLERVIDWADAFDTLPSLVKRDIEDDAAANITQRNVEAGARKGRSGIYKSAPR